MSAQPDDDYCVQAKRLRCKDTDTLEQRIKSMSKIDENGCWIWQRYCKPNGYAAIGVNSKTVYAHRVSYEVFVGPIPDGLQIDHLCRVRNCVNPEHLEPVTSMVNTMRSSSPSAIHARKTHCVNGHLFDEANTRVDPKTGTRICRACTNERSRNRRRDEKAVA